jgi:hypothetical protein
MQSSNKITVIGGMIELLVFAAIAYPAFAGGMSDSSIPVTSPNTPNPSPTPAPTPINPSTSSTLPGLISPTTQVSQQSGLVQVSNWGSSSSLTPPSCNGGCFFAVTRAASTTYGSGHNLEAMVGVNIPLGSNDGGAAEINRLRGEMEKYRTEHEIKLALSEKLAEALENGKTERATIIAMNLAPMLGYKDYQSLLKAVSTSKSTNPQIGNR